MTDQTERESGIPFLTEDVYPLSPVQEGMVFHELYAPDTDVYFSQYVFTLGGVVDPGVLRRAWQHALDRCPALRTVFPWEGMARPVQAVVDRAALPWAELDWRDVPREAQREWMRRHLLAERERRFDLLAPPLMRLALARTADDEWELAWSYHHLLLDGWSISLVLQDVLLGYDALLRGEAPVLPRRRPYRDYIAWLQRQDLAAAEAYWRGTLGSFAGPTPLPADRAPGGAAVPAEAGRLLSADATAALLAFAKQHRVTVNTLVQGAWGLLLSRHAGEDEAVFGATVTGRPPGLAGMERIIGLFINTLPVRVEIDGGARVGEWLQRLQAEQQVARQYDYSPLAEVQRWSGVPAGVPLFETILAFENHPVEESATAGGRAFDVERWERIGRSHYPLALMVLPGDRLSIRLEHDAARVSPEAAERLAGHLATLLDAMAAEPGLRLSDLSLLRADERDELLAASRAPAVERPQACVHELVAEQARRTPDEVAVAAAGGEPLTYAALEERSARLAHLLRARGVGPETRVALLLERSPELVAAALAVLRAGGAYVPLDPAYPAERLAYTLEDSGAALLLTRSALRGSVPAFAGEVVCLDAERAALESAPADAPTSGVSPRNAAYVVYTSGSTGRPKGVVVEHAGLAATLLSTREVFGLRAGETMPAMASPAFDVWAFETFAPLLAGGRVRLVARETVQDVERLAGELADVDALHAVPALMRELVAQVRGGPGALPRMRRVFIGGDAIAPELLEETQAAFPDAQVWAMYGPTEGTIISSATPLDRGGRYDWRMVGRPLPGVGMYVCDAGGNLLPAGVPGELCLAGAGVARGYLGRPELTAERFVPDPFSNEPGARLYRTGDRVRRRADGELEFLGRVDAQVKLRGFRIEPGEIEAVLLEHEAVREAVVVVREDAPGQRRLVGYVVPAEGEEASTVELRGHLAARLPEHMVPAAIVVLERLPLGATGKLDRRALPAPEEAGAGREHVAPATPTQRYVAEVWAEALGVEVGRVGVDDGFFELGGHSLLLVRVHARLRERFPDRVELIHLFEHRTLGALAEYLDGLDGRAPDGADALEGSRERGETRRERVGRHRAARSGRG